MLSGINGISFTPFSDNNSYFLFQIILSDSFERDQILLSIKDNGIGVSIHYATPVPLMSYYVKKYGYRSTDFPNALYYGNKSISLPVHSNLQNGDIKYIVETIKKSMRKYNEEK